MKAVLVKVEIVPHFNIVDDEGVVIEQSTGSVVVMFQGKFVDFKKMAADLEKKINDNPAQIEQLARRPLW